MPETLTDVDLSGLFEKDPKEITDDEFTALVKELRARRGTFMQAEQQGKRAPTQKSLRKKPVTKDISLGELGL